MSFYVYVGRKNGIIVYVGTTIQKPEARFRWHKANGKPLDFEVVKECKSSEEMLNEEFRLIKELNPKLNKKKDKAQNFNKKLTPEILEGRKGDSEWCQFCFKRRVNKGYSKCRYC